MPTKRAEFENEILDAFLKMLVDEPGRSYASMGRELGIGKDAAKKYGYAAQGYMLGLKAQPQQTPGERVIAASDRATKREREQRIGIVENLHEMLKGSIEAIPAAELPSASPVPKGAELEVLAPLSDMHTGKLVRWDDTGGLGGYDIEILGKRIAKYQKHIGAILEIEKSSIRRLWHPILGDMADGKSIYRGQSKNLDPRCRGIIEQVWVAVQHLTEYFSFIAGIVPEVVIGVTMGNHTRLSPAKGEDHWTDYVDYLIFLLLRERLANAPNIKFHVPKGMWLFWQINGWNFFMEHGDKIRSWGGIPFYGMERAAGRVQRLVNAIVHYYLVGHHHDPAAFGNCLMNGNWVGSDDFSIDILKKGNCPSQEYYEIHPHYGISSHRTIYLEDRREWGKIQPEDAGIIGRA